MSKFHVYLDTMYPRLLAGKLSKTPKSVLLLGPRQTGKSTLVQSLKPDLTINLAFEPVFLDYSSQPDLIQKVIARERPRTVFVDEVQRLTSLLNTVQGILDESRGKLRFYLTGSSARKLKRGKANLLPGRVVQYQLGPMNFIYGEPARLSTYRTEAGVEVDLILEKEGDRICVEFKSGARVAASDFRGLRSFSSAFPVRQSILLYAGARAYREASVDVLPWRQGLSEIAAFLA